MVFYAQPTGTVISERRQRQTDRERQRETETETKTDRERETETERAAMADTERTKLPVVIEYCAVGPPDLAIYPYTQKGNLSSSQTP